MGEKQWGKHSCLATLRADIREAHTILAHRFTDLLCSLHVYTVVSFNSGSFSQTEIITRAQ